jgi:hypothetical protein
VLGAGGKNEAVTIEIEPGTGGFSVTVTPPHSREAWTSDSPLSATQVLEELSRRGVHSTEITDALDATGADWRPEHDAGVRRRRAD